MKRFTLDRRERHIPQNPTLSFAASILKEAEGCDEIWSIGGGSTIDVGKFVAFNLDIEHTAIPTTAGTGSEVTKYAVFTVNGKKKTLEHERLIPTEYIHDPSLVTSCPPSVTASAGLDALSQLIESDVVKPNKNKKESIKMILKYLVKSYKNPLNEKYREVMLTAATNSGIAINETKTSLCHAISYPLTTYYDIPHGIACALSLPYFVSKMGYRYTKAKRIEKLLRELNIAPQRLVRGGDRTLVIDTAFKSERAYNTPKPIFKSNVKKELWL